MKVLFRTIAGSRLYGLEHEGSDWDYYTVVDRVKKNKASYSTHTIIDGVDSVVVDFGTWVNLCQKGVPQALEAAFSSRAEVDEIPEFRAALHGGSGATHLRTMKAMAMENDDFKSKRHVLRLGINAGALARYGRFNPTLNDGQVKGVTEAANRWDMAKCYEFSLRLAHHLD